MKYENYTATQLASLLIQRDNDLKTLREKASWSTYTKLTHELEEERKLRLSYQNRTEIQEHQLKKYRLLVGDEKPDEKPDEPQDVD